MSEEVYRGEAKVLNYTVTDDDGTAIDLTDKEVYYTVRPELPSFTDTETFELTGTNKDSNGNVKFNLSSTETDKNPKLYFAEVWVEYPGGEEYSAEIDRLFIRKRVSK